VKRLEPSANVARGTSARRDSRISCHGGAAGRSCRIRVIDSHERRGRQVHE
jgi:hypothetical protein